MENSESTCVDLEFGDDRGSSSMSDDYNVSLSFSEAYEGSSYSQYCSKPDGSVDNYDFDCETKEVLDSKRVLYVVNSDCSVNIESGVHCLNVLFGTTERDCRICHLSLQVGGGDMESGGAIELGCSCKNDMGAAHQHCAETWFRIKGNIICEICKSIAQNVVGSDHTELPQQASETISFSGNAALGPVSSTIVTPSFPYGHLLLDSMFACILFAVFLVWIFHFHMAI